MKIHIEYKLKKYKYPLMQTFLYSLVRMKLWRLKETVILSPVEIVPSLKKN